MMMHRFSSTKPSNHQTLRNRDNQRRHRQRIKDHITNLETQLERTQNDLKSALDRVSQLEDQLATITSNKSQASKEAVLDGLKGTAKTKEDEEDVCARLPPPPQDKSTTLCREAYIIIEQQNHRGIDEKALRSWLEPGFHGRIRPNEGCRVDNGILFELLDFISSE